MKLGFHLIWVGVAALSGGMVLLGYFFEAPFLQDARLLLMQWAVLLAAAALFVGLINLVTVHVNKIADQRNGWPYSALLAACLLITLVLGIGFGPDSQALLMVFDAIQFPVESSLMAVLAITLVVAGFRLVSRRRDWFSLVFIGSALLVMLGNAPWLGEGQGFIGDLRAWIRVEMVQVLAVGGARGILLGIALGATTMGLRVLAGFERPYGE